MVGWGMRRLGGRGRQRKRYRRFFLWGGGFVDAVLDQLAVSTLFSFFLDRFSS